MCIIIVLFQCYQQKFEYLLHDMSAEVGPVMVTNGEASPMGAATMSK